MFNKAQLAERGKHYFEDSKISKMYATTDGNFFYEQDKNFADSQAKVLKTSVVEITRGDLKEEKKPKPPKPSANSVDSNDSANSDSKPTIEDLRAEGKKLKIPQYWVLKEATLIKKIAEANGTA